VELLTSLALLACPIGMGAMMWFMMRGTKSSSAPVSAPVASKVPPSLETLQEERRRLDEDIERVEAARSARTRG
jgi:hypothetical protein